MYELQFSARCVGEQELKQSIFEHILKMNILSRNIKLYPQEVIYPESIKQDDISINKSINNNKVYH